MNDGRAQLQKAQSIRKFTTAGDMSSARRKRKGQSIQLLQREKISS
jgi:hypothetical protein